MRVNLLSFLKREPEAKYVVHCKGIEWKSEPQSLSEATHYGSTSYEEMPEAVIDAEEGAR